MGLKLDLGIREGFLEEVVLSLRSRGWGRERDTETKGGWERDREWERQRI